MSAVAQTSSTLILSAIQSSAASALAETTTNWTFDNPGPRIGREPFDTT